jgi:CheY-like chemotaxis protein
MFLAASEERCAKLRTSEAAVRQIVQKIVGGSVFNCEVTEAGDGEEALALARMTPFDAVFLDCNMPGVSGLATIKRLLLIQPMLKIVMISAERSCVTEDAALDSGACAFLHKPFTSDDVDRVLHAAFGMRSPNLKMKGTETSFDVAIEGSTIRLAHKSSGHIFEYLWCERPPFLHNAVFRPAPACAVAPTRVAPAAAKAASLQLRSARLVAA